MSCKHCKDRIRPVTMDPLKDKMIDIQAAKLNNRTGIIRHMGRLIKLGRADEAGELADHFIKTQKFKD